MRIVDVNHITTKFKCIWSPSLGGDCADLKLIFFSCVCCCVVSFLLLLALSVFGFMYLKIASVL